MATIRVDCLTHLHHLAEVANACPQGDDVDLEVGVVMRRADGRSFRALVSFHRGEVSVRGLDPGEEQLADFWLEGDVAAWQDMTTDIAVHGRASDGWLLDALVLFGDRISLQAGDRHGLDRFHQHRRLLQAFFDGDRPGDYDQNGQNASYADEPDTGILSRTT